MPQALALSSASQRTAARGVGAVRQSPSVLSRHKAWSTSRPAQPQWQRSSHAMPCSAPRPRGSVAAQAGATIESMVDPFLWANSGVTYAWILLIAAPRWQLTRTIFNSDAVLIVPCLTFFYFLYAAALVDTTSSEDLTQKTVYLFTEAVKDPRIMMGMVTPAYIAQDWVHVLAWDFIVGRFVWQEALEKELPVRHSLIATFMFGPVGLLVHLLTKYVVGAWRQRQQPAAVGIVAGEVEQEKQSTGADRP